ncbi:serpin family protein [Paenibacillus tritici]|uniref:serpin family protein n=1 Tax=Paenibacillus tritici TaxID=1873425 RepID=UPI001BA8492E|nr:serpin family protein [Paenibacillus tritici]QUL53746.1 serpin family protein [Paenibacillus tritici]
MGQRLSILLLAVLLLAGCSEGGSTMSYAERQTAAAELDSRLVEQSNRLGVKLLGQLWKPGGGNLTLSPYSVAAALALAYNGSAGETAEELGDLLGYAPEERQKLNTGHQALLRLLKDGGPGVELKIANSVWGMKGLPLRREYLKTGEDFYDAQIKTTDLAAPKSVRQINEWVSDHTEQKIDGMLTEPPGTEAVAVLVNALYFTGGWSDVFPDEATHQADFYPPGGAAVQVMMMKRSGFLPYAAHKDWQAVKLPYGEGQMEMVVVLPAEASSLQELADRLEAEGLPSDEDFATSRGTLRLPRFTASYGTELSKALQALGVKHAFDPSRGDFSLMADIDSPIYFEQVIHKTYIDVNERGTEAAASTVIDMRAGSAPPMDKPFEMTVNRPFLFLIRDVQTKVVLFLGAVENPLETD